MDLTAVTPGMAELSRFLQAISAEPHDLDLRLIFADWLEEQDDPRAELIRVQCQLEGLSEEAPGQRDLRAREKALLREHEATWLGPLSSRLHSWQLRRGMVEQVSMGAEAFLEHREELFEQHPVLELRLLDAREVMDELASCTQLTALRALDLSENDLGPDELRSLLKSPHLGRLEALVLEGNRVGAEGAQLLAKTDALEALRYLDLGGNRLGPTGAEALAGSRQLAGLRILRLGNNGLGNPGFQLLAMGRGLAGIERLGLANNQASGPGLRALAHATWPALADLDLGHNPVDEETLTYLGRSGLLTGLSSLSLASCRLGRGGGRILAQVNLAELRRLQLGGNSLGGAGLAFLTKAAPLAGLGWLGMAGNEIGDDGAKAFLEAAWGENLHTLDLSANGLRAFGMRPLLDAPALAGLRSLELRGNRLGDLGVEVLALGKRLGQLRHLGLRNNHIGDTAVKHLAGSPHTRSLRSLDLSQNEIGDEGLRLLVESALWKQLDFLDLDGNHIASPPEPAGREAGPPGARQL